MADLVAIAVGAYGCWRFPTQKNIATLLMGNSIDSRPVILIHSTTMADADKFDRQILNLSAAGLALSIIFLAISTAVYAFTILYASWVAFVVAMMGSIVTVLLNAHPKGAKFSRIVASMSFVLAVVLTVAFVYLNLDVLAQDAGAGSCDDAVYDT